MGQLDFVSGIVGFHRARGRRRLSGEACGSRAVSSEFLVGGMVVMCWVVGCVMLVGWLS